MKRTEMKEHAQGQLMHGIGNVLGYWEEGLHNHPQGWDTWTPEKQQEYRDMLLKQADRVARLLGFEQAWGN